MADSKSVINGWDKWLNITDAKRKKLDEAKAKWGEKWSELAEINSKKAKARTELEAAEKVREDAKKLQVSGLIYNHSIQNLSW